jgi:serine phosphatase RsbU (regulator of sigma subunit)
MRSSLAVNPTLVLVILLAAFFLLALYAAIRRIAAILREKKRAVFRQGRLSEIRGLAGAAESDLSIGREIQKKFLPLDTDRDGSKLSFGRKETETAVFFGYYAGAGEISGDYFDYQELGGSSHAIIKCDVAGKGIPAALIVIEVATMFLNYFKQWKPSPEGMCIEKLVYQINDFIETLGYTGRFAAFTLCIFNAETGDLHFCNAGDNIIHIFDSSERRIKNITLPQTPAAGVLPNSVVESKGGYRVQTLTLDHGDILLLYTDGIEESKRKFRDSSFNEIACTGNADGTPHGDHLVGERSEEMGQQRVCEIINAVMNRGACCLHKWHSGEGEGDMQFDFSGCEGGPDDLVMALVAAEKIFRCYYDSGAARDEWVLVEKKVDAFLKNHFLQYDKYCAETCECSDNDLYIYYTHLREDQQYDDLTILGVKRK